MDFSPTETRKEVVRWTTNAITGRYSGDLILAQARACRCQAEDILNDLEVLQQNRGFRILTGPANPESARTESGSRSAQKRSWKISPGGATLEQEARAQKPGRKL
jgi:hypothetical protein